MPHVYPQDLKVVDEHFCIAQAKAECRISWLDICFAQWLETYKPCSTIVFCSVASSHLFHTHLSHCEAVAGQVQNAEHPSQRDLLPFII